MKRIVSSLGVLLVVALCYGFVGTDTARADLLGYWAFDDEFDAANALDYSGNANHGTVSVATYTADGGGRSGAAGDRAMDFGSVISNSATVQITNAASAFTSITTNNAATISLWIKGDTSNPVQNVNFAFLDGGGNRQLQTHLPWSGGTIYWDVAGTGGANRINKTETDQSKYEGGWNHYVFTKDGTGTNSSKIYQNGALWHQGTTTASVGTIATAFIGSAAGGANSYAGQIDDFAVWDEELSSGDIGALYAGTKTPGNWAKTSGSVILADNPLAFWRLDESSGATFADISGNGHNMTASGSISLAQSGATADGNKAADFSGGSTIASSLTGLQNNFSVEFWLNPDSHSNYNQLIGASAGWGQFRFHTGDNGEVWVGINSGNATGRFSNAELGNGTVVLNEWQHFVFTFDDINATQGEAKFYKDGKLLATKTLNIGAAWTDFRLFSGTGTALDGGVDDVAIFDYALTADQVGAHFAAASIVPAPAALTGGLVLLGIFGLRRRR